MCYEVSRRPVPGLARLPTGVVGAEEATAPLLGGGVLGTASEALSWEPTSSDCSWEEPVCCTGDVTVTWRE